jgi:hypothetical protein
MAVGVWVSTKPFRYYANKKTKVVYKRIKETGLREAGGKKTAGG